MKSFWPSQNLQSQILAFAGVFSEGQQALGSGNHFTSRGVKRIVLLLEIALKIGDEVRETQIDLQTSHHDKDERFMATSDLTQDLEQLEGVIDNSLQAPIRNAIIKQLEDSSTDVQTVAVKWYSSMRAYMIVTSFYLLAAAWRSWSRKSVWSRWWTSLTSWEAL